MPIYQPKPRIVQVRGTGRNTLLFLFNVDDSLIEIRRGGVCYLVRLDDLMEFVKGDGSLFRAEHTLDETSETSIIRDLLPHAPAE